MEKFIKVDAKHYVVMGLQCGELKPFRAVKEGKVLVGDLLETHNVRPVINIKVNGLKGEGTLNNPYTFE